MNYLIYHLYNLQIDPSTDEVKEIALKEADKEGNIYPNQYKRSSWFIYLARL